MTYTMKTLRDTKSLRSTIWSVRVSYFDVDWKDEKHPSGQRNTVFWPYFPSNKSVEEIGEAFTHFFIQSLMRKDKQIPTTWKVFVENKGKHRWWLTYFAHETNQRFESKADAMADFDDWYYKSGLNKWVDWTPAGSNINNDVIWCPMGAEDYWRRKVCECDDCKENGICRITH